MEDVDYLIKQGEHLHSKKQSLNSLWQLIADHFYPQRAHFTLRRHVGEEFADHLMTSYPVLARRELGDSVSTMLRRQEDWFRLRLAQRDKETNEVKRWLEWASGLQRRAMYDRQAQFKRATKEGDHDWAAFGQCVISVELNRRGQHLVYRDWHLKDCAWAEGDDGAVDTLYRNWKPTARELVQRFKVVHESVVRAASKAPFTEIECCHAVVPGEQEGTFRSVFIDKANKTAMEDVEIRRFPYVVPRWSTVSESQYAYSPATIVALPDARLIQSITLTLLEAGERYTSPPMLAVQEAIRGDVRLDAGGVTWVDASYDERLGEVLRPVTQDRGGFPAGFNIREDIRESITEAFYLNKLKLPPAGDGQMTAYEVSQRVQEFIRSAIPLFDPMEDEYNGALCDSTFDLLMAENAFGEPPEALEGESVDFEFESPLNDAEDREKGTSFDMMVEKIMMASQIEPRSVANVDVQEAFRDALSGIGVPSEWIRDEKDAEAAAAEIEAKQQMMQAVEAAGGSPAA